ncbi:glucose sorbosone dehydrogenase [bacterium]|nr:glucose sorbosone dehydrogenase [bacterium]|tara:strand:- start:10995 stop:12134 length:1140 start_codon:yes stop_codon:yes gene_type:complete
MKKLIIFILLLFIVGAGAWGYQQLFSVPEEAEGPPLVTNEPVKEKINNTIPPVTIIAENLTIPWDIAFLSNDELLITERIGNLVFLNTKTGETDVINIPGIKSGGEGGLLGLVLHPEFETNKYLYLYFTHSSTNTTLNRVSRFVYQNGKLVDEKIIIDDIPGAIFHDGGRMAFGPDGLLYVTTGDATTPESAQDLTSLSGKILRVHDDGSIPEDNPFGDEIYSYGHRNPQGLTWDDANNLWSTEHGRSGVRSGLDELNKIVRGGNYGWPESEGDTVLPGTTPPALHSGPNVTWAPASATYLNGSIFFGGLRGEALYEAIILPGSIELKEHFKGEFGRIRTTVAGPDGMLYITTSNRDGRGSVRPGDDKIIRLNPSQFSN